jgi:hypothetical protein
MPRNVTAIALLILPFSALAQSEPTSMPSKKPEELPTSTSKPSKELEELITRTCLSEEGDTEDRVRLDACRRYVSYFPNGVWLEDVQLRIQELDKTPSSVPVLEENSRLDLSELAHPRKKGDFILLVGLGNNSPSGNFGLQTGYSVASRVQVLGAIGVDDRHLRGGAMTRFYLKDSRISPSAVVGLSFAPGRATTGEGFNEASQAPEIVSIKLGPSLLAHAGVGFSFRYVSGFSLNADVGYAQALFEQTITPILSDSPPLTNDAQVRDGGFFVSVGLGYTF